MPPFQTWLDERLFGWSRSASRGTSAWSGTRSQEISRATSRAPSPDASDDEEGPGDYDNILGYLEVNGSAARGRRSAQSSSYADLQKVRRSSNAAQAGQDVAFPLAMTTATEPEMVLNPDDEGLHVRPRRGSRSRKFSLSDRVSVERISVVDKEEAFEDATREINQEILKRRMSG